MPMGKVTAGLKEKTHGVYERTQMDHKIYLLKNNAQLGRLMDGNGQNSWG